MHYIHEIYDIDFNPDSEEHRGMLQCAIYLLDQMGINIENYEFHYVEDNAI